MVLRSTKAWACPLAQQFGSQCLRPPFTEGLPSFVHGSNYRWHCCLLPSKLWSSPHQGRQRWHEGINIYFQYNIDVSWVKPHQCVVGHVIRRLCINFGIILRMYLSVEHFFPPEEKEEQTGSRQVCHKGVNSSLPNKIYAVEGNVAGRLCINLYRVLSMCMGVVYFFHCANGGADREQTGMH